LTALADSIPWIDSSSKSYPWDAIKISGLKDVEGDREVWETGRQGVKAGLASVGIHPFFAEPHFDRVDDHTRLATIATHHPTRCIQGLIHQAIHRLCASRKRYPRQDVLQIQRHLLFLDIV
jgi:hypothetical protein